MNDIKAIMRAKKDAYRQGLWVGLTIGLAILMGSVFIQALIISQVL